MTVAISQLKSAYDEVPYASHPFPQATPENLAAIAHLFGLEAPPVATARVLELGCSSGGNVIPFAARTPGAQILGIDLSGVQIDLGKQRVEALGLSNIELVEADLSNFDGKKFGTFDYIICHGVYSWVPAEVQESILRICRENLAADGVAYVSYNVYPGWKTKEILRDAMLLRGAQGATPGEQLAYAKGMLDFLEQVAPDGSAIGRSLEQILPALRNQKDYYLSHEYLEPFNSPCYFRDFVARAEKFGLGYLAEAQPSIMFASNYGERVAEPLLRECGHSQVLLEQYLDFVADRTFRQTLLVHGDRAASIRYRLDPERLRAFHFAAYLPCSDDQSRFDDSRQTYGTNGAVVTTERPEFKAAMEVLSDAWPATVPYEELLQHTAELTTAAGLPVEPPKVDELLEALVIKGLIRVRLSPVAINPAADRISINETIRRAAELSREEGAAMTFNAWHEPVVLDTIEAWLLPELDGMRGRADLLALLHERVLDGEVVFERQGARVSDAAEIQECEAEHVDTMPARLAALGFLRMRGRPVMLSAPHDAQSADA